MDRDTQPAADTRQSQQEAPGRAQAPKTDLDTLLERPATFGPDMRITDLDQAIRFAQIIVDSGFAPKGMTIPGCVIAIQMGYEVGLSPMAAVQSIAPINNRPTIWGDACLALVRRSGQLEHFEEVYIDERGTDAYGCKVTVKRKGFPAASDTFTVADAKRAQLWGKAGTWSQYPSRMLKFRARGFVLRDQFGDVLKGLVTAEEAMDMPTTREAQPAQKATAAPDVFGPAPEAAKPEPEPEQKPETKSKGKAKPEAPEDIESYVWNAVEAVGIPQTIIESWCHSRPANHAFWCVQLSQLTVPQLQAMAANAEKVRQEITDGADKA